MNAGEHCGRNFETWHLCCLEVDDELELCWLDHWKVGRPLTLENSPSVNTHLAISVYKIVPITNESADLGEFAQRIDYGLFVIGSKRHDLIASAIVERVLDNNKP